VSGRVVNARTGAPVAGANVEIFSVREALTAEGLAVNVAITDGARRGTSPSQRMKSAQDGTFTFRGLLPGKHHIEARAPGYLFASLDGATTVWTFLLSSKRVRISLE